MFQTDPHWRDYVWFYEYFHGDNGAGLGASHQTGWTGIIARLMHLFATTTPQQVLELGKKAGFVDVNAAPPAAIPRGRQASDSSGRVIRVARGLGMVGSATRQSRNRRAQDAVHFLGECDAFFDDLRRQPMPQATIAALCLPQ